MKPYLLLLVSAICAELVLCDEDDEPATTFIPKNPWVWKQGGVKLGEVKAPNCSGEDTGKENNLDPVDPFAPVLTPLSQIQVYTEDALNITIKALKKGARLAGMTPNEADAIIADIEPKLRRAADHAAKAVQIDSKKAELQLKSNIAQLKVAKVLKEGKIPPAKVAKVKAIVGRKTKEAATFQLLPKNCTKLPPRRNTSNETGGGGPGLNPNETEDTAEAANPEETEVNQLATQVAVACMSGVFCGEPGSTRYDFEANITAAKARDMIRQMLEKAPEVRSRKVNMDDNEMPMLGVDLEAHIDLVARKVGAVVKRTAEQRPGTTPAQAIASEQYAWSKIRHATRMCAQTLNRKYQIRQLAMGLTGSKSKDPAKQDPQSTSLSKATGPARQTTFSKLDPSGIKPKFVENQHAQKLDAKDTKLSLKNLGNGTNSTPLEKFRDGNDGMPEGDQAKCRDLCAPTNEGCSYLPSFDYDGPPFDCSLCTVCGTEEDFKKQIERSGSSADDGKDFDKKFDEIVNELKSLADSS